jgi:hypothetical protein
MESEDLQEQSTMFYTDQDGNPFQCYRPIYTYVQQCGIFSEFLWLITVTAYLTGADFFLRSW